MGYGKKMLVSSISSSSLNAFIKALSYMVTKTQNCLVMGSIQGRIPDGSLSIETNSERCKICVIMSFSKTAALLFISRPPRM